MNGRRVHSSSQLCRRSARGGSIQWFVLTALTLCAAPLHVQAQLEATSARSMATQDEALRRELLSMTAEDQSARAKMMQELQQAGMPIGSHVDQSDPKYLAAMAKVTAELSAIDDKNRARLKEIVKLHGWPGKSMVGKDGANAAWLLVQHADADHEFQKSCLALMEAMPEGEVAKQGVAYLTDRVLIAEKKTQRYGTQMDGEFNPKPLEDAGNVDKRRAEVGLPPLGEYIKSSKQMYKVMSAGAESSNPHPD
jgi:hypothetical protein